jgi:hypothetical protein
VLDYKTDAKTEQAYNNSFSSYLKFLEIHYKDFEYDNQVFSTPQALYKYLKSNMIYAEVLNKRHDIFSLNNLKCTHRSDFNIDKDLIILEQITGISLDKHKDSWKKYIEVRNVAKEKVNGKNKF